MVAPMEIVLQWLDDLDDLVVVMAVRWRYLCRFGLSLGLAAALMLAPVPGVQLQSHWVIALSLFAIVSVLAWTTAALSLARPLHRSPLNA